MSPLQSKRGIAVLASVLMLAGCFGESAEDYVAAAKRDIAKPDPNAAIIQLKNALQKNPSLGEARYLLGHLLLASGDGRGAYIELMKAKDAGYKDPRLVPALARALFAQGEYQKILDDFGSTKIEDPEAATDLLATIATSYDSLGKPAKALEMADAAVAADGNDVRAQILRVRFMADTSDLKGAMAAVESLAAKMPDKSEVWQVKGDLLNYQMKSDEALAAYRRAVELNKNNAGAHAGILTVLLRKRDLDAASAELKALRDGNAGWVQVQLFTALIALERDDLKAAREAVQLLLKNAPDDPRIMQLAGTEAYRRGSLLEAESFLNKAIHATPNMARARILLARTELRLGDAAKALTALQPMLADDSTNVEALGLAAEAYLLKADAKRAEAILQRASRLDPADPRTRMSLAMAQIGNGKYDEGVAGLRAVSSSEQSAIADMALVTTFMQRNEWDKALKAVDAVQAKLPNQAAPQNLRGRVELARGNKDGARSAFEAALKADPVYFPAAASLAALDLEAKQPDVAATRFQKILAVDPKNMSANLALVELRYRAGASKEELVETLTKLIKLVPGDIRPRLAMGEILIQHKDPKQALSVAQEAMGVAPDNPAALKLLAQAQAATRDFNQAASSLNKLINLDPAAPEPHMLLADVYAAQGDTANAIQSTKRALAAKADFQPAQMSLIAYELAGGRAAQALEIANQMVRQHPDEPDGYIVGGDIHTGRKEWPAAIDSYRAALKVRPTPVAAVKLHRSMTAAGRGTEADQFAGTWMASNPKDGVFLSYLGDMAMLQSNFDAAEKRYRAVLEAQPTDAMAANNVAWLLSRAKKPEALRFAQKANELAPDQPSFMDTLAQAQADAGDLAKAVSTQKKAVELSPDIPLHRLHLARFYVAAGQKAAAREELNRLKALGDKFTEQAEVTSLLGSL